MEHPGRWWLLLQLTLAAALREAQSTTLKITTPYSLYTCPEGQSVTLTCKVSASGHHGPIYRMWYFSNKRDQRCSEKHHIPGSMHKELHHESGMHHEPPGSNSTAKKNLHGQQANHHGQASSNHHGIFHISMANLTLQQSGFYCCYVADVRREHGKDHVQQQAHSFIELRVQKAIGTFPNCTLHPAASTESESITATAVATVACILGILCMPLILLLIYRQRQAITNRRAHELVRMESNARGIENPVFDADPAANAEPKPRPQLTYMASRLLSDSGRHLLSEPNTPVSPPVPGDCFFPSLEPVPDSPNLMDVSENFPGRPLH